MLLQNDKWNKFFQNVNVYIKFWNQLIRFINMQYTVTYIESIALVFVWKQKAEKISWDLKTCNNAEFHAFVAVCWLFSNLTFSKNYFRNITRVPNILGPDLGPNCLQRLSADDKSRRSKESVKTPIPTGPGCNWTRRVYPKNTIQNVKQTTVYIKKPTVCWQTIHMNCQFKPYFTWGSWHHFTQKSRYHKFVICCSCDWHFKS